MSVSSPVDSNLIPGLASNPDAIDQNANVNVGSDTNLGTITQKQREPATPITTSTIAASDGGRGSVGSGGIGGSRGGGGGSGGGFVLPITSTRLKMSSFLARAKGALTPSLPGAKKNANGTMFATEKSAEQLFPATHPDVDGEDCLHDCESCSVVLPRKWEIDEEDKLYGHVKGWATHLIVATGKTDWVRDVVDEKGSLMEAVGKHGVEVGNGKVMLSASDIPTGYDVEIDATGKHIYVNEGRTRCLVLPKWRFVEGVQQKDVPWLMDEVIGKGATNLSPLAWSEEAPEKVPDQKQIDNAAAAAAVRSTTTSLRNGADSEDAGSHKQGTPNSFTPTLKEAISNGIGASLSPDLHPPEGVSVKACGHRAIILMCSHKTRDWRCGASAPLLRKEFERHLRPLGLYRDLYDDRPGGVGIYFINHVGGHKYSANVMIYRRESSKGLNTIASGNGGSELRLSDEAVQGIWLARVRPEDCENIVKYTVLQGKLVKPLRQLRGGFDRSCGKVSW